MHKIRIALFFGALALMSAAADAQQTNVRVRGTITAVDGNVLSVKSRDGKDLKLQLVDNTTVAAAKAITLADLKLGDYVGSTSIKRPVGTLVAREVHTIARTVPEGHGPWDLEPGSMMTNANVGEITQTANGRELTLKYKDGTQKILVPEGTPIATTVPADRSFLVPGEYVFVTARVEADGKMTALRIQVSKDGVKPPQ
ncbi:MAG TPA: DUF5666 domain-containing protein [Acidiferrobacterales bacterium]|nr:DUF5666 domain-containing protein [Acidiferrobacterales bacterium]